jgi:hypothetical protein
MAALHLQSACRPLAACMTLMLAIALTVSSAPDPLQRDSASGDAAIMAAVGDVEDPAALLLLEEQHADLLQQQTDNGTRASGSRSLLQSGVRRVAWRGRCACELPSSLRPAASGSPQLWAAAGNSAALALSAGLMAATSSPTSRRSSSTARARLNTCGGLQPTPPDPRLASPS